MTASFRDSFGPSLVLLIYERIRVHAASQTSDDTGIMSSSAVYGNGSCQNKALLLSCLFLFRDSRGAGLDKVVLRDCDVGAMVLDENNFFECEVEARRVTKGLGQRTSINCITNVRSPILRLTSVQLTIIRPLGLLWLQLLCFELGYEILCINVRAGFPAGSGKQH